jgi:hypothetical protein
MCVGKKGKDREGNEVSFSGAGCDRVFEPTFPNDFLPHKGEADHCFGRKTLPRKLG